jgi:hypothetical protein
MQENNQNVQRVATRTRSAPPCVSNLEEALSIQSAPARGSREEGEELDLQRFSDEQKIADEGVFHSATRNSYECDNRQWPQFSRPGPFFNHRPPQVADAPKRLPATVPSSGGATWIVSAPEIERAIQTLLVKLKRTPTDAEIAKELRLSVGHYQEALTLLNDIEREIAIRDFSTNDGPGDAGVVWVSGGLDSAVFCCLRSEMLKLFMNAVRFLPEREGLVVSLRYCESLSDMELTVTLDIDESTLTRLNASAYLHLRARIFGSYETDYYVASDKVRPANANHKWSSKQTGPEAHVYMSGGQRGWLPRGNSWEALGSDANYDHFAQTWFSVDEDGQLRLVQREEHCELRLNDYRWKRDS